MIIELPSSAVEEGKIQFMLLENEQLNGEIYLDLSYPSLMITKSRSEADVIHTYQNTIGGGDIVSHTPTQIRFEPENYRLFSMNLSLIGGQIKPPFDWSFWKNTLVRKGTLMLRSVTPFSTSDWELWHKLYVEDDVIVTLLSKRHIGEYHSDAFRLQVHSNLVLLILDRVLIGWAISQPYRYLSYRFRKIRENDETNCMELAQRHLKDYLRLIWQIEEPELDTDLLHGANSLFKKFKPIVDHTSSESECLSIRILNHMAKEKYSYFDGSFFPGEFRQ